MELQHASRSEKIALGKATPCEIVFFFGENQDCASSWFSFYMGKVNMPVLCEDGCEERNLRNPTEVTEEAEFNLMQGAAIEL